MGFFESCKKFLREGLVVLSIGDALLASAVARLATVESKGADAVFASCGGDMWAAHETVKETNPSWVP